MTAPGTADVVRELSRPAAYGGAIEEIGFLQTHISWLFFAGERVYKVKRPVDLGFVDFTDPERRRQDCEDEVRLNARLAPGVYLGVVPIVRGPDGHLVVDGEGEPVEWAVEMVRLPAERMLARLLDRGEIDNARIRALSALLADFHADSATGDGVDEHGSPEAVRANVLQNFEQLEPFVAPPGERAASGIRVLSPTLHDYLRRRASRFLETRRELLLRRVARHRIREGHGDLHAENICFTEERVVAYDCLEFSPSLRCGDVASDLAFLAMDLDQRGYAGFSGYLVKHYAERTGDAELADLVTFYKGYRAVVRGKVAALSAADPEVDDARRDELVAEAVRYLLLAAGYELPPALILTCGLPATGKSWLAARLARPLRASVLRSDVRRKRGVRSAVGRVQGAYGTGLYSPERKEATYDSMLADALDALRAGHSAIVDATFSRRRFREPFVDAAARSGYPLFVLHVRAPEEVVRERMARRAADPDEPSDADLEVYLRERSSFEPPEEIARGRVVELSSGADDADLQASRAIDQMITHSGNDRCSSTS